MVQRETISLSGEDLRSLPIFFQKIYYNEIDYREEENKLFCYRKLLQGNVCRMNDAYVAISKTVDKRLFLNNEETIFRSIH